MWICAKQTERTSENKICGDGQRDNFPDYLTPLANNASVNFSAQISFSLSSKP